MSWVVVTIKPNQSKKAEGNLAAQGFVTFFPRIPYNDQGKFYSKDLFPGYAFVKIDNWSRLDSLNATKGVNKVMLVHNKIPKLDDSIILNIKRQLKEIVSKEKVKHIFKKNDLVKIRLSVLNEHQAEIIDILDKKNSQKILLAILNSKQTIWVDKKDIVVMS